MTSYPQVCYLSYRFIMTSNKVEVKFLTDDLVTVPAAGKALGHPKVTIYRWIDAGKIISIKLGGILFIPKSEIERIKKEKAAQTA